MEKIRTEFDLNIDAYVVYLPPLVTLKTLKMWGSEFLMKLERKPNKIGLLFDTSAHNFESIECLKWVKEFFSIEPVIVDHINRVAFVQPTEYRSPEVVSESEAYFVSNQDARKWLHALSMARQCR
jgi:hypothetical protein